jgi:hypothetical protein
MQRLSRFVNSFSSFAVRAAAVVKIMVPQSPEYTTPFGLLIVIFDVSSEVPLAVSRQRLIWKDRPL